MGFVIKLKEAYPSLILNATKMWITDDGTEPTYIVRDEVVERLVQGEELHTFLTRWRNSSLLFYSINRKGLI